MFISRRKYEERIQRAVEEIAALLRDSHADHVADIRRIANEEIAAANRRAEAATQLLAQERQQHFRDLRHFASMWLRHNKSTPLPPTAEEKAEAKAEAEEKKKQPVPLTDIQIAMRDANRREAARNGVSQEQADKDFEQKILSQMMET